MHCDYALHLIVAGKVGAAELAEVAAVFESGVTSFKLFMNSHAMWPGDGAVAELLEVVGAHGGCAVLHCENADVIERRTAALAAAGKTSYRFTEDSRPAWVEGEATARSIRIAHAAGCPIFIFHVTCEDAAREIADAQARGWDVFAETCHNYIVFSKDDVVGRPDGANWATTRRCARRATATRSGPRCATARSTTCRPTTTPRRSRTATRSGSSCRPPRRATTASRRGWPCCSPRPSRSAGCR